MFQKYLHHGFGQCPLVVMPLYRIDLLILQNSDGTRILSLSLSFPRYLHRNRINEIEPWTFTATKKLRQLWVLIFAELY